MSALGKAWAWALVWAWVLVLAWAWVWVSAWVWVLAWVLAWAWVWVLAWELESVLPPVLHLHHNPSSTPAARQEMPIR